MQTEKHEFHSSMLAPPPGAKRNPAPSPHPLPRGERGRGEGEQSLTIILAGCAKKSKYFRLAIVGIGPRPRLEGMILEAECGFRIDAGAKVNPVRLVLRCCQHELPQGENSRVEI